MSDRSAPRPDVRRAFEEVAPDLRLDTVEPAVEARCVGVAFAIFAPTIDTELADPAPAPPGPALAAAPSPEQAVIEHLQGWESLAPEQFAASWRDYATDPYIGFGVGWAGTIDQQTVDQWMRSDELREAMETHPPFTPRQVKLSNVQVTFLSPARAAVTYRAEETYRNGKVAAGNSFAVLMHVKDAGWRIALASKGTRHEAILRG